MSSPGSHVARPSSPVIPYARQWIDDDDVAAVCRVLRSDFLTQGPAIEAFEQALCHVTGAAHAVVVASGTAALHLACLGLGFGPGRTGVTSPITFAASANCFLYSGGVAAFADVNAETGLITPESLEDRLGRLSADGVAPGIVIAVSMAGCPGDLAGLATVCGRHGWTLVEDAAHSLGAEYRGAEGAVYHSGSCAHSRAAILSFHPVKHVCAGEGGAILTQDAGLAGHLRRLRTHGIEKPSINDRPAGEGDWFYEQRELGFHYRMTDIQAALGLSQLGKLPAFLHRRRELARRYAEALAAEPFDRVLRAPAFEAGHAYHLYVVHFRTSELRRAAYDHLAARGIRTQVHYIPVYRHPHYQRMCGPLSLPGAEAWYRGCLSLPMYPALSDEDQSRVLEALAEFALTHG